MPVPSDVSWIRQHLAEVETQNPWVLQALQRACDQDPKVAALVERILSRVSSLILRGDITAALLFGVRLPQAVYTWSVGDREHRWVCVWEGAHLENHPPARVHRHVLNTEIQHHREVHQLCTSRLADLQHLHALSTRPSKLLLLHMCAWLDLLDRRSRSATSHIGLELVAHGMSVALENCSPGVVHSAGICRVDRIRNDVPTTHADVWVPPQEWAQLEDAYTIIPLTR